MDTAGTQYALAVTGVAGPEGGTPAKPVGTVYIGLAQRSRDHAATWVRRLSFRGDRGTVRDRAVASALQMLRFALLDVPADMPLIAEAATG